jgi:hypothetical protein
VRRCFERGLAVPSWARNLGPWVFEAWLLKIEQAYGRAAFGSDGKARSLFCGTFRARLSLALRRSITLSRADESPLDAALEESVILTGLALRHDEAWTDSYRRWGARALIVACGFLRGVRNVALRETLAEEAVLYLLYRLSRNPPKLILIRRRLPEALTRELRRAADRVRPRKARRKVVPIPEDLPSPWPDPALTAEVRDEYRRARKAALAAWKRMPAREQRLLARVEVLRQTQAAVAMGEGRSRPTVNRIQRRGRERYRKHLNVYLRKSGLAPSAPDFDLAEVLRCVLGSARKR